MSEKIQFFSEKTRNFYQLLPTKTIPVLRINSVPMQRFGQIDPLADTKSKIAAAEPKGVVLDTCTGLGYTAIEAAKKPLVKEVITIEKDAEVLRIAKLNPASKKLFSNPKIKIVEGDSAEKIKEFEKEKFDCIIHDPPTFKMAPELYNENFYSELHRVLKKSGALWHYAPMPGKIKNKKKAESFVKGIIKRLGNAGFKNIEFDENSSGIIAKK